VASAIDIEKYYRQTLHGPEEEGMLSLRQGVSERGRTKEERENGVLAKHGGPYLFHTNKSPMDKMTKERKRPKFSGGRRAQDLKSGKEVKQL